MNLTALGGAQHMERITEAHFQLFVSDAVHSAAKSGLNTEAPGPWSLMVNEPVVSSFSGAAAYQYPLALPPGRNGLQPSISLSYNSKGVDGFLGWRASGWVGLGWSIDAVDIVRENVKWYAPAGPGWITYDNRFRLVMNGASYRLHPADPNQLSGRYYAEDAPGLYIERLNHAGGNGSGANRTTEYWLVKTLNGTVYRLGHNSDSEQVIHTSGNGTGWAPYSGPVDYHTAYRWRLDWVTDVYGNEMKYEYVKCRTGWVPASCAFYSAPTTNERDLASYLSKIYYNKQGSGWLTTVEFVHGDLYDDNFHHNKYNDPIFVELKRLDSVKVWWQTTLISEHKLNYATPQAGLPYLFRLESVEPFGLGGAAAGQRLPGPTFSYVSLPNRTWSTPQFHYHRLSSVDNGYGGVVEFQYQHDNRGDSLNYFVSQKRIYDGLNVNPARIIDYNYSEPCYDHYINRFISADTIVPNPANPQSFNRYSYVRNNPMKHT
jgi:hypothetical protein